MLTRTALHMQAHIFSFFRQAYESDANSFRQLAEQYLTQNEKDVLAHILSSA